MPGFAIDHQGQACSGDAPSGDAGDVPSATDEYARKHRFRFIAFEPLEDILIYAHRAGRPRPEIDKVTIHHSQEEIYTPAKHRWLPIEITFYENVHKDIDRVSQAIYDWWSNDVIDIVSSRIARGTIFKDCELAMTDGVNEPVWIYRMYGCWPSKVTPDDLDYSDTGLAEISFTLEMQKAEEAGR